VSNTEIADRVGVTWQTLVSRRAGYAAVIAETLRPPPNKLGVTH
jgi:hypothetical protein